MADWHVVDYWRHWRRFDVLATGLMLGIFSSIAVWVGISTPNGLRNFLIVFAVALILSMVWPLVEYDHARNAPTGVRVEGSVVQIRWREGRRLPEKIPFQDIRKAEIGAGSASGIVFHLEGGHAVGLGPGLGFDSGFAREFLPTFEGWLLNSGRSLKVERKRRAGSAFYEAIASDGIAK